MPAVLLHRLPGSVGRLGRGALVLISAADMNAYRARVAILDCNGKLLDMFGDVPLN